MLVLCVGCLFDYLVFYSCFLGLCFVLKFVLLILFVVWLGGFWCVWRMKFVEITVGFGGIVREICLFKFDLGIFGFLVFDENLYGSDIFFFFIFVIKWYLDCV